MTSHVRHLNLGTYNTRRNLPTVVGRKRGESNFMRAFERAYFAQKCHPGMAAAEFALGGFGVADLVWIAWRHGPSSAEFSALSLEKQLARQQLFAFEAKLNDWQRGLQQAFRYRYFADKSVVVMPAENAGPAIANLGAFKELGVALWTFDRTNLVIREHYTPGKVDALNREARTKAITLLLSRFDLRKFGKHADASL
jgi:hypothetical protein